MSGIFTPSDYSTDPFGYLANQTAHAAFVGAFILAGGICLLWTLIFGDFPTQATVAITAGLLYAAYEIGDQGWQGLDTVEDWWFVSIYGATGTAYSFRFQSLEGRNLYLQLDWVVLLQVGLVMGAHLAIGAVWRARNAARR